jgi:hypothetical protein
MATFRPGDYYEDCLLHPCLCVSVDDDGDGVSGISLVDGSGPRSCSVKLCGIRKLTLEEAVLWKANGPQRLSEPWVPLPDKQWWWPRPIEGVNPGECLRHLFDFSLLFLRGHAEDLLGAPIHAWFMPTGSFNAGVGEAFARVEYEVKAPRVRTAIVRVEARREGRLWPISHISVQPQGSAEPIVFSGEQVRGCGRAG